MWFFGVGQRGRSWGSLLFCCTALIAFSLAQSARAGDSIFDDDWKPPPATHTPSKPATPAPPAETPVEPQEPATPPPAPAEPTEPPPATEPPATKEPKETPDTLTPATPSPTPVPAVNAPVIDMGAAFDLARDVQHGGWSRKGDEVVSTGGDYAVLRWPYQPPAEYDFRIDFTRNTGKGGIWLILPKGNKFYFWLLGAQNQGSGFYRLPNEGRNVETNIRNGKHHTLRVEVRSNEVRAVLDDQVIQTVPNPPAKSIIPKKEDKITGDPTTLGLATMTSEVVFHHIEVAEVSGKGVWKSPLAAAKAGPAKMSTPVVAVARHPIPAADAQDKSRKLLREVYAKQLSDHTTAGRRKLCEALLAEAAKVGPANASDQFVLFGGALSAAREAANLDLCSRAADSMAQSFDIDALAVKAEAAAGIHYDAVPAADAATDLTNGLRLLEELLAADDFAISGRLCISLQGAARASHNTAATATLATRSTDLRFWQQEGPRARTASDRLATFPFDPEANFTYGRFLCFAKSDWSKGLKMLAQGTAGPLKSAATLDLAGGKSGAEKALIGDAWWEIGDKDKTPIGKGAATRAALWYQQALADSSLTETVKAKVEKHIAQLPAPPLPPFVDKVVPRGASVDLLAKVRVPTDVYEGALRREGTSVRANSPCMFSVNYGLTVEYDLRFTLATTRGRPAVELYLAHGDAHFGWQLKAENDQDVVRIGGLDDKEWQPGFALPAPLQVGQPVTFTIKVRNAEILTYVGDKLIGRKPYGYPIQSVPKRLAPYGFTEGFRCSLVGPTLLESMEITIMQEPKKRK